jgi:hypothetical protein
MAVENIERKGFRYTPRSCMLTIVIIIVGTFVCAGALIFITDTVCQRNAAQWLPRYPDAQIVAESRTFLRTFGVGVTQVTLTTPDDPTTVRSWYNDERSRNEANPVNLLATMNLRVSEGENGGSIILLSSECAWR